MKNKAQLGYKIGQWITYHKKQLFLVGYWMSISFFILISVCFVSIFFSTRGVNLPWISQEHPTIKINVPLAAIASLGIGIGITAFIHQIARRFGSKCYWYGVVTVILAIPVSIVIEYGGVCAACRISVCDKVVSCGVETIFEIHGWHIKLVAQPICKCYV